MRKPTPADAALALGSFVLMALGTAAPAQAGPLTSAVGSATEFFNGTVCLTNTGPQECNVILDYCFTDLCCAGGSFSHAVNLGNVTACSSASKSFCFSDNRFNAGSEYEGFLGCMSVCSNPGNQTITINNCPPTGVDFVAGSCGPVFVGSANYTFTDSDPVTGAGNLNVVGGATASAPEPPAWMLVGSLLSLAGLRKITG